MLPATEQSVDAGPYGLNGLADLALERRAGRTRLTRVRTRPPLLVQQGLYPDDGAPDMAYVFLANPTGGLLANDRHQIAVNVGQAARAHVTTQSATKIHSMERGRAEQSVALHVAAGGYLEYLPDPLIPFRDAELFQDTIINLEPGAAVVYGDVITPGRVARGEVFQYRKISGRLAVYRQQEDAVYREAFDLAPTDNDPSNVAVLGSVGPSETETPVWKTFASILILCDAMLARAILDSIHDSRLARVGAAVGASSLPDGNGVGVKIVGAERSAVQSAATVVWSVARRRLIGVPGPSLRKY